MATELVTVREALEAQVREDPFDDGPRLVYADWLEEQGEAARAEFIRVQCELADHAPNDSHYSCPSGCNCHWCVLRQRERELWWGPRRDCGEGSIIDLIYKGLPDLEALSGNRPWGMVPESWTRETKTARILADTTRRGEPYLVISRGLIGSVSLTAAQFLGGPCGRCDGTGPHGPVNDRDRDCPDCPDAHPSRVEGVAAALFKTAPVTEVRISDREPEEISVNEFGWTGHKEPIENAPHRIPWTIWKLLSNSLDDSRLPPWRLYPTREAALSALSVACVTYGRSLGDTHHPGCDTEQCPRCSGQLISCGCLDTEV